MSRNRLVFALLMSAELRVEMMSRLPAEVRRRLRDKKPLNLSWDGKPTERYPQMQSARNFANKIWN